MSDSTVIVVAIVGICGQGITAYFSYKSTVQGKATQEQSQETHRAVNGLLEKKEIRDAASNIAIGVLKEKTRQENEI